MLEQAAIHLAKLLERYMVLVCAAELEIKFSEKVEFHQLGHMYIIALFDIFNYILKII